MCSMYTMDEQTIHQACLDTHTTVSTYPPTQTPGAIVDPVTLTTTVLSAPTTVANPYNIYQNLAPEYQTAIRVNYIKVALSIFQYFVSFCRRPPAHPILPIYHPHHDTTEGRLPPLEPPLNECLPGVYCIGLRFARDRLTLF